MDISRPWDKGTSIFLFTCLCMHETNFTKLHENMGLEFASHTFRIRASWPQQRSSNCTYQVTFSSQNFVGVARRREIRALYLGGRTTVCRTMYIEVRGEYKVKESRRHERGCIAVECK